MNDNQEKLPDGLADRVELLVEIMQHMLVSLTAPDQLAVLVILLVNWVDNENVPKAILNQKIDELTAVINLNIKEECDVTS